jgi:nifR3 family TIM-barrel protein
MTNIFEKLGLPPRPIILAPLAGVSDIPFRRICAGQGADLTYVEMLSAVAINHNSERTMRMMGRHASEKILGVQVTSGSAHAMGEAVKFLNDQNFDTIDINMGCPVQKVTKSGSGSAILKDPQRVLATVQAARAATSKPLSAKIRLGWDGKSRNFIEVGKAIQDGGADWITMHGRYRSDDYSNPVDIDGIAELKDALSIPVIGNGNLMSMADAELMRRRGTSDGLMVSRGALGNPWVFREITSGSGAVSVDEWAATVLQHLQWQQDEYGLAPGAAVCMRKHLLWYAKGWPGAKRWRERLTSASDIAAATTMIHEFHAELVQSGATFRLAGSGSDEDRGGRFVWDPKFEMDRGLDRGVGCEML